MIETRKGNFIVDGENVGPTITIKVLMKRKGIVDKVTGVFISGGIDQVDFDHRSVFKAPYFPAIVYIVEYKGKEHEFKRAYSEYADYNYEVGQEITLTTVKYSSSNLGEWYQVERSNNA